MGIEFKGIIQQKEKEILELNEKLDQTILLERYQKALQERDAFEALVFFSKKRNIKNFQYSIKRVRIKMQD